MFAPRARQHHDENAAAGLAPTRTPGPSRSRVTLSPVKGHATTGGKLQRTAPAPTSVSPKKLFGNATPGTSKLGGGAGGGRFALGDKTNNKQRQAAPPNGAGSPTKGGASTSPAKSPTKSIRRPPTTPAADKSYATSGSASGTVAKGKQPAMLPLQTPAANIGRRGMMKQRMGELMDAQRAASGGGGGGEDGSARQGVEEDVQGGPALDDPYGLANLTEEERYPEIEYMPPPLSPSVVAQDYGFDARPEFSGLPRGKELAQMGAGARFGVAHLCRGEEKERASVEVPAFDEVQEGTRGVAPLKDELVKSIERDEQEDEERYLGKKKVVAAAPGVPRRAQVARVSSRPAAVRTGSTTSAGSSARVPAAATMRKPVASATASRLPTTTTSRPAAVSRSGATANNTATRPTTSSIRRPAPSSTAGASRSAATTSKANTASSNGSARPLQRTTTAGASASQRFSATAHSTAAPSPQKDALSRFAEEQLHAGLLDGEDGMQGLDLDDEEEDEVREKSAKTLEVTTTADGEAHEAPQDDNTDSSA